MELSLSGNSFWMLPNKALQTDVIRRGSIESWYRLALTLSASAVGGGLC